MSSVTLFVAEGVLFFAFLVGLWRCALWAGDRLWGQGASRGSVARSERASRARFVVFQVVFLACWSVLFKVGVYAASSSTGSAMFRQGTAGFLYANASEVVLVFLVLAGLAGWVRWARS